MFVKKLIQKSNSEVSTSDPARSRQSTSKSSPEVSTTQKATLKPSNVDINFTLQHGVPASASVLAYEPGQRLLAIGCRDGRIKIFGREGVEILLRSPAKAPCKCLEFVNNEGRLVHITTRNDIEIWDLSTLELVFYKKWEVEITGFSVIQGSHFVYIGDETGQVSVLKDVDQMPYTIPAQMTLCGLVDSDTNAPSVVSILPQPDAVHSRVVIAYGNGLIVLWGLHEIQVLAVRGGTENQQKILSGESPHGGTDEEEEKEICCACWACSSGSILAVGYTDGDLWLWRLPVNAKAKSEKIDMSRSPLAKLRLSSEDFRMPVVVTRWSAPAGDSKEKGYLYVFGGQEMGVPEGITVVSLNSPASQLHVRLPGPFADLLLLPNGVGRVTGAILLLTTSGCLDIYEEISIMNYLNSANERSTLPSVPFKLALASSTVTVAKLVSLSEDSPAANSILKIPRVLRGYVPSVLPLGTRWPVNGGSLNSSALYRTPSLYITGHESGFVNIWDASTTSLDLLASLESKDSESSSVSALDFCCATGILAVGNDEGVVFVYSVGEAREGALHIFSKGESTKKQIQHPAGFQCFALLRVHQAAVKSITITCGSTCLLVGDDVGMVSILDLESLELRFHGKCFDNEASVVALAALSIPSNLETQGPSRQNKSSGVVFVLSTDADVAALDSDGRIITRIRPKNPSSAVSCHLLDSSGAVARSLSCSPTRKSTKQSVIMQVIQTDESGDHIVPTVVDQDREEKVKEDNDCFGSDDLLLLCSEDSLRLYSISIILQGLRSTVRKERLDKRCCSASVFESRAHGAGLLLLYSTGELEIRSLPDLNVLTQTPLSDCLNWEFQSSPSFFHTFSVSSNGRLAAIDCDQEVLFMSVFKDESDLRLPDSYPSVYDKDVAAATSAAIRASVHVARRKSASQFQDLLGGVMKEIKQSLGADTSEGERTAHELPKLFSKQLFPAGNRGPKTPAPSISQGSTSSSPRLESPLEEETSANLDIDDIDLDDDEFHSPSPSGGNNKKKSVIKKLRNSFKGTSKKKGSSKSPPPNEDEERNMLFEGGSTAKAPAMRTADEIRAAYGHKKAGEANSAAAHARDRLMERQERLQNISRRTEEMQEGAENFASLAEELARSMKAKKWYQI